MCAFLGSEHLLWSNTPGSFRGYLIFCGHHRLWIRAETTNVSHERMRNEGKKNERRSTPPSFGILLLPRQIGSEHVLHHKLPSKQTKKKKDGFQFVRNKKILVIIAFTKQKKKHHSKDFLSFSLSLSVGKKYTLQEGSFWLILCSVHHSVQQNQIYLLRCIIIVSIITFHQKGEREREIRDLSRARTTRESNSSAPGRDTKQKNLSLLQSIRI